MFSSRLFSGITYTYPPFSFADILGSGLDLNGKMKQFLLIRKKSFQKYILLALWVQNRFQNLSAHFPTGTLNTLLEPIFLSITMCRSYHIFTSMSEAGILRTNKAGSRSRVRERGKTSIACKYIVEWKGGSKSREVLRSGLVHTFRSSFSSE